MGASISIVKGNDETKKKPKELRRKNSFCAAITKYVKNPENDLVNIWKQCKAERDSALLRLQRNNRDAKLLKIADAVAAGSMRELRSQVTGEFVTINRRYREHWFGDTLLHIVCREGFYKMLKFMVDPKNHSSFDDTEIDFNQLNDRNRTALFYCFTPNTLTYTALVNGIEPDGTPISVKPDDVESMVDWIKPGTVEDRQKMVLLLLDHGANPNLKDYHDYTALHYAVIWGWTETVKLLLDGGGDRNAPNMAGHTPLMTAVEFERLDCVKILLSDAEKVDIHVTDVDGITPLIMASDLSNKEVGLEIVSLLIKAGFDMNKEDKRRRSPLSIACKSQNINLVNLLLDNKVRRRKSLFDLLEGVPAQILKRRMDDEIKLAAALAEEMARKEKEREENQDSDDEIDWRAGSLGALNPLGQWVQYKDKRGRGIFFYNTVSRESQWEEPIDYRVKQGAILKEATYGMSFYH